MSARLRWYVGTVCVAGGLVLAFLLTRLDLDRAREVAGPIAVFAAFMVVGELVTLRVDDQNRLKEVSITSANGLPRFTVPMPLPKRMASANV